MPNAFDASAMTLVSQLTQRSWTFDMVMVALSRSTLLKGGVLVGMFWWAWFDESNPGNRGDGGQERRSWLVVLMTGCLLAAAVARILARTLPLRVRPLQERALQFQIPYGASALELDHWSAFPSDHATLYFALAAGLLLVSRRLGGLAFLYCALAICLPRLYLGLHYPTDLLAGALIGTGIIGLLSVRAVRTAIARFPMQWLAAHPASFYAFFFLWSYEIAELFGSGRALVLALISLLTGGPEA